MPDSLQRNLKPSSPRVRGDEYRMIVLGNSLDPWLNHAMSRKKKGPANRAQTESPFDELAELMGLAETAETTEDADSNRDRLKPVKTSKRGQKNTQRGRIDIIRQSAGRGGKAVTVAQGFKGIGMPEKKALLKQLQKACGVGGTLKDGTIEIQGDNREAMMRILTEAGFNPVFAGG